MEVSNIVDFSSREGISDAWTDLIRTEAQQLIAFVKRSLKAFLGSFLRHAQTLAVRNGHHPFYSPIKPRRFR
jgi:putative transposase